jgi:hypothetical protein
MQNVRVICEHVIYLGPLVPRQTGATWRQQHDNLIKETISPSSRSNSVWMVGKGWENDRDDTDSALRDVSAASLSPLRLPGAHARMRVCSCCVTSTSTISLTTLSPLHSSKTHCHWNVCVLVYSSISNNVYERIHTHTHTHKHTQYSVRTV